MATRNDRSLFDERTTVRAHDPSAGWAIAIIVIIAALIIGGYVWVRSRTAPASSGSNAALPAGSSGAGEETGNAPAY